MKKYQCLIVDDEDLARELIQAHLSQLKEFELVASCSSAIEANQVLKNQSVDLLFLDIEMPVLKGTDFLKTLAIQPKVIFTTAYRDYALDGFDLNAVDYLLKPITFARFFRAVERFLESEQPPPELTQDTHTNTSIFVRENRKQVRVQLDQILYIQGLKDYIQIHLAEKSHVIKQSMSAIEKQLSDPFIRVHRSYIVNLNQITAYTKNDIEIGAIEIPIGEQYKSNVYDTLRVI